MTPSSSPSGDSEARELLSNLYCRDLDCSRETYEKKGKQEADIKTIANALTLARSQARSEAVEEIAKFMEEDFKHPFVNHTERTYIAKAIRSLNDRKVGGG